MRLFIITLLICFGSMQAQQIKVLTEESQAPIPNVAIFNKSKTKSVITDFDGKADISNFNKNEILIFKHVAHVTKHIKVSDIHEVVILESDENALSEIVISTSKWAQKAKDISQKIVSFSSENITFTNPQTSADLLQQSGQVYIQKSQLGGGSPIIRGFSTNRLLLTVDGVRMNTAIFRGGNVQNVISIDPFTIDRTEVILGPGSIVYGSDAVGGVMNFYTKKPTLGKIGAQKIDVNAIARYATANEEKTGHVDFNIGFDKWAFLTSISYTDFEDLKMGSHGPEEYLRTTYIERINGEDVIVQNKDPKKQVFTGYNQTNLMQKVRFSPNEKWNFDASFIYTTTSDYPRYDRLTQRRDGALRFAEWYYGPQEWLMGNLQASHKALRGIYDEMKITAAYQHFEESRNSRRINREILSENVEKVDAYSFNIDFEKALWDKTTFYYGGEYVINEVGSTGRDINIITNESEDAASRYPDGATWQSAALYASLQHKFTEKLTLQAGARYNHVILYSQFDDHFFDFPFDEANLDTGALTGNIGLSWLPNDILQWKFNFSTAFRAPNVDDVGKIFDSEPGSVVVPNPDLKHEYAYNGELGLKVKATKGISFDFATYYTLLNNALVRRDFSLDGETEIEYQGELSNVQAIQNAAQSKIFGFEFGTKIDITNQLRFTTQYSYIGGEEELDNGEVAPARHVAPQFGNSHLILTKDKWKFDAYAMYSGAFSFEDLSPTERGKDNLYAIDDNGNPYSPSWYTLNLRSQYQISKSLQATATLENITDQRYRTYSSGIAAAGRNLIVSLKYSL